MLREGASDGRWSAQASVRGACHCLANHPVEPSSVPAGDGGGWGAVAADQPGRGAGGYGACLRGGYYPEDNWGIDLLFNRNFYYSRQKIKVSHACDGGAIAHAHHGFQPSGLGGPCDEDHGPSSAPCH